MTAETINCKIILERPVEGVTYALQSGSGHSYEVLQKQEAYSKDLIFEFAIPVKKRKEGSMILYGPIAQGAPSNRFVYLNMGSYAGQMMAPVSGRIKVPLPASSNDIIRATKNSIVFSTRIAGTKADDGTPVMATIKPFEGWKLD